MKDMAEALPGIERIKIRFLVLLEERQGLIAHHALAAWEGTDPSKVRGNLDAAQSTLHQIAGSAGSLGFDTLGVAARECENEIITHLGGPNGNDTSFPAKIMHLMDAFVSLSQSLLARGGNKNRPRHMCMCKITMISYI